jgi:hypothetical protein
MAIRVSEQKNIFYIYFLKIVIYSHEVKVRAFCGMSLFQVEEEKRS